MLIAQFIEHFYFGGVNRSGMKLAVEAAVEADKEAREKAEYEQEMR